MKKSRLISLSIGLLLSLEMPCIGYAGPVEDGLAARNPALAALRQHDEKAFAAAVAVIADHERAEGLTPGQGKLPETTSPGRDMARDPARNSHRTIRIFSGSTIPRRRE